MLSKPSLLLVKQSWLVPLLLAIVTLVMHHSALNGFFRHDDGWHLGFAACYAPWEYFFVPAITREISYANLTPWNPLTYDINLTLFGLNPVGYYAHQLISLWFVACMSFLLLRLWVGLGWAIFGAVLFLVGAPTVHIAQELMTGHYLEGLIFASVAIYGFVRAIRGDGRHWFVLGVLGYILACTCKEIYVPIPVLLLALPEGDWKKRFRFVAPFLVVTFLYLCWRFTVLGSIIGGYRHDVEFSIGTLLLQYAKLPMLLFRHDLLGYLALIAFAILLLSTALIESWLLVLVAAGVLLVPLAPLTISPGLNPDRYLFAVWWAIALGVAVLAGRSDYLGRVPRIVLVLFIGAAAIQAGRAEMKLINAYAKPTEALYRSSAFALAFKSRPDYAILPPLDIPGDYAQFLYNGFLSAASKNCGVREPYPKLLSSVEAIAAIDPEKTHVYHYDTGCNCMKEITSTIPELLSTFPPKRESRRLLIRILPSPYRRRGNAKFDGGLIENVNVVGETVEVVGWARLRDDEPLQNIAFFVPVLPVKQSLVSIERPDIAEHLNNSQYLGAGFRATLQFSSSANAAYAATRLCAQKIAGGSFAMIDNPSNQECSVLWSAPDVDIQPIKAQ